MKKCEQNPHCRFSRESLGYLNKEYTVNVARFEVSCVVICCILCAISCRGMISVCCLRHGCTFVAFWLHCTIMIKTKNRTMWLGHWIRLLCWPMNLLFFSRVHMPVQNSSTAGTHHPYPNAIMARKGVGQAAATSTAVLVIPGFAGLEATTIPSGTMNARRASGR